MSSSACPSALAASRPLLPRCLQAGDVRSATDLTPDSVVALADFHTRVDDIGGKRKFYRRRESPRAARSLSQDSETKLSRLRNDTGFFRELLGTLRSSSRRPTCSDDTTKLPDPTRAGY